MTTEEEVLKRIVNASTKEKKGGWVYFKDSYPYREDGLFRARPDGSALTQISKRCDKFEIKNNKIYVTGMYSELDETGYLFDRYEYNIEYSIDGDEIAEIRNSEAYRSSSD